MRSVEALTAPVKLTLGRRLRSMWSMGVPDIKQLRRQLRVAQADQDDGPSGPDAASETNAAAEAGAATDAEGTAEAGAETEAGAATDAEGAAQAEGATDAEGTAEAGGSTAEPQPEPTTAPVFRPTLESRKVGRDRVLADVSANQVRSRLNAMLDETVEAAADGESDLAVFGSGYGDLDAGEREIFREAVDAEADEIATTRRDILNDEAAGEEDALNSGQEVTDEDRVLAHSLLLQERGLLEAQGEMASIDAGPNPPITNPMTGQTYQLPPSSEYTEEQAAIEARIAEIDEEIEANVAGIEDPSVITNAAIDGGVVVDTADGFNTAVHVGVEPLEDLAERVGLSETSIADLREATSLEDGPLADLPGVQSNAFGRAELDETQRRIVAGSPTDPEGALASWTSMRGDETPEIQAESIDAAVPEEAKGDRVAAQADLEQTIADELEGLSDDDAAVREQEIRAEYWADNEHYVDPDTGIAYHAEFGDDGRLVLNRRDETEGVDGQPILTSTRIEQAAGGEVTSSVGTMQTLAEGGTEATYWNSAYDAEGNNTALSQTVIRQENLAETGETRTVTQTAFDPTADFVETDEGFVPVLVSQSTSIDMERGTLDEPPGGSARHDIETTFNPDGTPATQTSTYTQTSDDFDAAQIADFQANLSADLDAAEADDFDPNNPQLTGDHGLPVGAGQTTITEELLFDSDGDLVGRSQVNESIRVEERAGDRGESGVEILQGQQIVRWPPGEVCAAHHTMIDDPLAHVRGADLDELTPLTEDAEGEHLSFTTIDSYDPDGSAIRENYPHRESVVFTSSGTVDADGNIQATSTPPVIRSLQEGADDDWAYDKQYIPLNEDGTLSEDLETLVHTEDFDWHERGAVGWVRDNLGLIGAGLTTTGLVLQAIPVAGNAVGAGFIAAGLGVTALDTALQTHAVINGEPGASWGNVAFSALGLIPAGRFAALRAATGFRQTAVAGVRAGAYAADAGYTGYVGADIVHGVATGEGVTAEDLLFAASVGAGHLAQNRIARRTPNGDYATTDLESIYFGESSGQPAAPFRGNVRYYGRFGREFSPRISELQIQDGVVLDTTTGRRADTADGVTAHSGDGIGIFVMDQNGRIYSSTEHTVGEFHHSSFLAGQPVAAAGEVRIENGRIVEITDGSGHYRPAPEFTAQFLRRLQDDGVDLSTVQFTSMGGHFSGGTAAEVLAAIEANN